MFPDRPGAFGAALGAIEAALTSPKVQEVKVEPAAGVAVNVSADPSRTVMYW